MAPPARRGTSRSAPHRLLGLQRQAGNRAVTGSVLAVQRDHTNNADDFMRWIQQQGAFTTYSQLQPDAAREQCHDAAKDVEVAIRRANIACNARVFVTWEGDNDRMPLDHVVVVATVDGSSIVVDPTRHQFERPPCALPEDQWQQEFLAAVGNRGVATAAFPKAAAAASFAEKVVWGWDPMDPTASNLQLIRSPQVQQQQQQGKGCCTIF